MRKYISCLRLASIFLLVATTTLNCNKAFRIRDGVPPTSETQDWALFAGSEKRANYRSQTLRPPLYLSWKYKASSAVGTSLIVVDSLIYVPTLDGRLEVVEIETGTRVGRLKFDENIETTSAYHDGSLYFAYRYGEKTLARYDLKTGTMVWKIDAGDIASEPLVNDDGVYVAAMYRHIDKYELATGKQIWRFKTEDQHRSSPTLAGGILVVGCDNGDVYALDAKKGTKKWKTKVGASVFATPAISDSLIFFGAIDSVFYALNLENGARIWTFKTKAPIYQSAASDGNSVVFGTTDGTFYCLNGNSGKLAWTFEAHSVVSTAPLISGDIVYFGSLDQKYYGLNLANGAEIWNFTTEGRIRTSPIISRGYLLGASEDRDLLAFSQTPPAQANAN